MNERPVKFIDGTNELEELLNAVTFGALQQSIKDGLFDKRGSWIGTPARKGENNV